MQEILSGNHKALIIKSDFAAAETVDFASGNTGARTNLESLQTRFKFKETHLCSNFFS